MTLSRIRTGVHLATARSSVKAPEDAAPVGPRAWDEPSAPARWGRGFPGASVTATRATVARLPEPASPGTLTSPPRLAPALADLLLNLLIPSRTLALRRSLARPGALIPGDPAAPPPPPPLSPLARLRPALRAGETAGSGRNRVRPCRPRPRTNSGPMKQPRSVSSVAFDLLFHLFL